MGSCHSHQSRSSSSCSSSSSSPSSIPPIGPRPITVPIKTPPDPDPEPPSNLPPTTLLDLPNELFLIIADSLSNPLPDPVSINSLLQTNRRLASLLTPWLHKLALLDREDGTPALHWSILHNYIPLSELLLTKSTPELLARQNSLGQTALHVALERPDSDDLEPETTLIESLIHQGIPINTQTISGETALQLAVSKGYRDIVKLLLSKGADVSLRDSKGQTVLHVATRNWGNGGSTIIATFLLDSGVRIDARNNLGETALHKAVLFAHTSMVQLLLDYGASTCISDNWWGGTPLHWAADMGKHDIGKLLLVSGADVSARDVFKGGTPFHWAARRPTEAMLRLLLSKGADIDMLDNSGKKAMEWTVRQERRRGPREEWVIVELLRRGVTSVPESDEMEMPWAYGNGSGQANAYSLAALYCLRCQDVRASG